MYFVWESNAHLSDDFLYVTEAPDGLNQGDWIRGKGLLAKPATVTLVGDSDSPATLSDMILTQFELPVLSPRAISTLADIGVDNIEYFPINIKRPKVKGLEQSYRIGNIVGLVFCLDKRHATFDTFPDNPNKIMSLEQYHILEEKVTGAGPGKKTPLVFRLGEFSYHVLAHESVKSAFEKQKLTGALFTDPAKYV
jgi:hypothetical protein